MSHITVHQIVSELINDSCLIRNWERLAGSLQVPKHMYSAAEIAYKNDTSSIYHLLAKVIEPWVTNNENTMGSASASVNVPKYLEELCHHMRLEKFIECAETISRKFEKNPIIVVSLAAEVLGKWWPDELKLVISFVERQSEGQLLVNKLHEMLNQEEQKAVISQHACISGLGGIGKSTLAKWYATSHAQCYDHIIWLDCGEDSLGKSIDTLHQQLCGKDEKTKDLPSSEKAKQIFTKLKAARTLVIYDNAEDYDSSNRGIKNTLPGSEKFRLVKCIITSRLTSWGSKQGYGVIPQLPLEVFSKEESVKLLTVHLEKDINYGIGDLEELSEMLGHLPLALQIALAHVNQVYPKHTNGVSAYIKLLSTSFDTVLWPVEELDDYKKGLMAIITEAEAHVKGKVKFGNLAWDILCYMAYLPSENIPVRFIASVAYVGRDQVIAAGRVLKKYSLITLTLGVVENAGDKSHISIHRLLRQSISMKLKNEETSQKVAAEILRCNLLNVTDVWFKWETYVSFKGNQDLRLEMQVTQEQIYAGINLDQFLANGRFRDALTLLEVYKELTVLKLAPTRIPTVVLPFFSGFVHYMLNEKAEALECLRKGQLNATNLPGPKKKWQMSHLNLFRWTSYPAASWDDRCRMLLPQFSLWISKIQHELGKHEDAQKEAQKIPVLAGDELELDTWYDCLFRFDEMKLENLKTVNCSKTNLCYNSCMEWVKDHPDNEFDSCLILGAKFTGLNGVIMPKVDYHLVLPVKCKGILVMLKGETKVDVRMSQLWQGTKSLELLDCYITWDKQQVSCGLKRLEIQRPINPIPKNVSLRSRFPHLDELDLRETTVPYHFFPARLSRLYLDRVEIRDVDPLSKHKFVRKLEIPKRDSLAPISFFSPREALLHHLRNLGKRNAEIFELR